MLYALLAAALVLVDQVVKALVRANFSLGDRITLVPYVMDLTYVQNTGAAFSLLRSHTWLLAIISLAVSVALVLAIWRRVFTHPVGLVALSVVLGGAVGNLIDRVMLGSVTDMFMTTFITFPVFNVADICVVLGGIATVIYVIFFYDKLEKKADL